MLSPYYPCVVCINFEGEQARSKMISYYQKIPPLDSILRHMGRVYILIVRVSSISVFSHLCLDLPICIDVPGNISAKTTKYEAPH